MFDEDELGKVLVTDITYFPTKQLEESLHGNLYLEAIIDSDKRFHYTIGPINTDSWTDISLIHVASRELSRQRIIRLFIRTSEESCRPSIGTEPQRGSFELRPVK